MKKVILSFVALIVLSIALLSCGSKDHEQTEQKVSSAEVYTCPMHLEVFSDKPGSCPKCGMDLVKKETIKKETQPDSTMQGDSSMKM